MNKERVIRFLESRESKRIAFLLGVILIILTAFISINPEPYLKFGYIGVFVFNLFGPGTLLIPSLSLHMNVLGLTLASALGMALTDSFSWLIGNVGHTVIPHSKKAEKIENGLRKYGSVALFFWSLIPFPYDLIGLIAGYLGFTYRSFIVPTFLGKFIRFILLGYGVVKFFG